MPFQKGYTPWNKGLTKETDERIRKTSVTNRSYRHTKEAKEKISKNNARYWKGKHHSEDTKAKLRRINLGRKHTDETKAKMSKAHKGEKNHRYGISPSIEVRSKISNTLKGNQNAKGHRISEEARQKIREARLRQILPKKDTSIEVAIQNELNQRSIIYEKHLPVCGICQPDIVFPERKIAVQCDGDYWHNLPNMIEKARRQDQVLRENGWQVLRFWGSEIREDVSRCVDMVEAVL